NYSLANFQALRRNMTISYEEELSSLMLRWRGSLWKAVLKDLIAFYFAYYIILFFQWYYLDEKQKNTSQDGLFGAKLALIARWWEQFNYISWPDKLMMMVATCLPGDHNLPVRQAIARWSSLQAAIAWSGISVRTLKRFPTKRHLVEADLMTEEEYKMFTGVEARHGKWFVPIMWISNLLGALYRQQRIDSVQLNMLMQQLYSFRDGFAMLFVYDWVKIPLVYTQVVAIATYGYFMICLIGRQPKIDEHSMRKEVSILFPVFTTFQILFYIGWLKVGQYLMNPFGEDDDDFELNYVLDRNTFIAHMMATDLANQLPTISRNGMRVLLPHTKASFKIQA
ncbi:hypothetical protein WUBG_07739, partial [Wuchereria bancrofti]